MTMTSVAPGIAMIMLRLIPLEVGENWILYTSREHRLGVLAADAVPAEDLGAVDAGMSGALGGYELAIVASR